MPPARRSPSTHGIGAVIAGFALVRVRGASMQPTLHDGDLLLVRVGRTPEPDALVVLKLPGRSGLAIKRVVRREPDGWWVERDNPHEGVDSWVVGAIAAADVVAQVVQRVWPLQRIPGGPKL